MPVTERETVVEVDTDFGPKEAVVEEELPEGEPKESEEEPVKEPEPAPAPAQAETKPAIDEAEKLRKDNARMGHSLRENDRRIAFLEKELNELRVARLREEDKREHDKALAGIDHLKDEDPVQYLTEREKLHEERLERRLKEEREIKQTDSDVAAIQSRQQEVNSLLMAEYPAMGDLGSPLFKKTMEYLHSRYTPEQVNNLIVHQPDRVYDIVSIVDRDLRLQSRDAQDANKSRESRVNKQTVPGAVVPNKGEEATSKLTREQLAWCKKRGWGKERIEKYAKFVNPTKEA